MCNLQELKVRSPIQKTMGQNEGNFRDNETAPKPICDGGYRAPGI